MHSFDPHLKRQNVERRAQTSSRKRFARCSQVRSERSFMCCSSAELDLCLTILCQLVGRSMTSITEQCGKTRRGGLFPVNSLHYWSMISFCSWTMQHFMAIVLCKLRCVAVAGGCWHNVPTLPDYFFLA